MAYVETKGLVLKEVTVGESDKIVTILSKSHGKISVSAKGARKPKSPYVAGTQMFTYSDFILYEGRTMYTLTQLEVIETFHSLRHDLTKLAYGAYMMELLEHVALEGAESEELLKLSVKSLAALAKTEKHVVLITRIFEWKLLALCGYMPQVLQCVNCGKDIHEPIFFSAEWGGTACEECQENHQEAFNISYGALYTLQYILHTDISQLFGFAVDPSILDELSQMSKQFIQQHIGKNFKTAAFIESL